MRFGEGIVQKNGFLVSKANRSFIPIKRSLFYPHSGDRSLPKTRAIALCTIRVL
ncbi:MAG: hypothetical protein F6J93_07980 [Oscillatoria sp. SIO1A7]|nr:hypothetical protein [Oscillatoria sp. SIO1A7]